MIFKFWPLLHARYLHLCETYKSCMNFIFITVTINWFVAFTRFFIRLWPLFTSKMSFISLHKRKRALYSLLVNFKQSKYAVHLSLHTKYKLHPRFWVWSYIRLTRFSDFDHCWPHMNFDLLKEQHGSKVHPHSINELNIQASISKVMVITRLLDLNL